MSKDYVSLAVIPTRAPRMTMRDRWTNVEKGKGRPVVLQYFRYRDDLRQFLPGYRLPDRLDITFLIPMPKSWSNKKKAELVGAPHQDTPDIDNLVKGFMDAFNRDEHGDRLTDCHVYAITAEKYWAEQGSIELRMAA